MRSRLATHVTTTASSHYAMPTVEREGEITDHASMSTTNAYIAVGAAQLSDIPQTSNSQAFDLRPVT